MAAALKNLGRRQKIPQHERHVEESADSTDTFGGRIRRGFLVLPEVTPQDPHSTLPPKLG